MSEREDMIIGIAVMDRQELIQKLLTMRCGFPIDFSREYLESIPLDNLRHIVLDASFHDEQLREAG
ncbi:MAG: hypothetical protein KAR11_02980 [Phycisphaerae bacterium]|nr:hypothetical protein [Phycisphaerae bacterium]